MKVVSINEVPNTTDVDAPYGWYIQNSNYCIFYSTAKLLYSSSRFQGKIRWIHFGVTFSQGNSTIAVLAIVVASTIPAK